MSENITNMRVGYILLFLGLLGGIVNTTMIIMAFYLTGSYHSVDTSLSLLFIVAGVALVQIERIIDNQNDIKKLCEHIAFNLSEDKTAADDFLKHHPDFLVKTLEQSEEEDGRTPEWMIKPNIPSPGYSPSINADSGSNS